MKNREIIKIEAAENNKKTINYRVTEKCNYRCPYCWLPPRTPINLEGDFQAVKIVQKNLEHVINYYLEKKNKITLFLTGGEPSIYPLYFYENLFKIIAEKKIDKVILSTNFSADPQWFTDFSDKCRGNTVLEIKAAFHPSECKITDYIKKIGEVKNCADKFTAHFTFDDNNFIGMEQINQIKALGVNLDIVAIHSKKDEDYGRYKISNPDLINLLAENKNNRKIYTVYYKDGSTEELTLPDIKRMDFSQLKPICQHTNITILNNKIGINCEYMRSIKRIIPEDWLDLSTERTKKELYRYLKNECSIICDKKMTEQGNNCKPAVLAFKKDTLLQKIYKFFSR